MTTESPPTDHTSLCTTIANQSSAEVMRARQRVNTAQIAVTSRAKLQGLSITHGTRTTKHCRMNCQKLLSEEIQNFGISSFTERGNCQRCPQIGFRGRHHRHIRAFLHTSDTRHHPCDHCRNGFDNASTPWRTCDKNALHRVDLNTSDSGSDRTTYRMRSSEGVLGHCKQNNETF